VNGVEAQAPPVRVEGVTVEPKIPRGEKGAIRLRISVAPDWHLQEPDGLKVEAWGGSEFTFEEIPLPPPSRIEDPGGEELSGWAGTLEANLSFSVSRKAAKGKRDVSVRVTYRACGEGACRPDAVASLSIPVEIV
jgi:hypothetical protein